MEFGERIKEEALKLMQVPEVMGELRTKGLLDHFQKFLVKVFDECEGSRKHGFRDCLKMLMTVMGAL